MARIKKGTIPSTGAAYNLDLGFTPDYIIVENYTNYATPVNGEILKASWYKGMATAYAFIETFDNTGGALGTLSTLATTNGFTEYTSPVATAFPSPIVATTAITQAVSAYVTATAHGITDAMLAAGTVFVSFSQVVGMIEINGKTAQVTSRFDADHFYVSLNTSAFTAYASGGYINKVSLGNDNVGIKGITLGTSVVGANLDVLYYTAYLDDPIL